MTTLAELKARRPVDKKYLEEGVKALHQEAKLYRLQQIRKDLGITQKELAQRIGVSQNRISQIEHGNISSASIGTLDKYFNALGVKLTVSVENISGDTSQRIFVSA